MRKKIKKYIAQIDEMLADSTATIDYEREQQKHFIQIQFFMHERLVHEIIMVLFALVTVLVFIVTVLTQQVIFGVLLLALLVLLVPYVIHYYVLENGVQYMYEQYDEMERRKEKKEMVHR